MQLRFCFWPDYEAHILTVLAGNFFEDELNLTWSRLTTMSGSIQFREAAKHKKRTPTEVNICTVSMSLSPPSWTLVNVIIRDKTMNWIWCFRNLIIGHGCIWEERQQQPELRPGALQAVWKSIFISFLFKSHACLERYLIKIIEFDFFKNLQRKSHLEIAAEELWLTRTWLLL